MNMHAWISALATAWCCCVGTALASTVYSGSITGMFTEPVFAGVVSDLGVPIPYDNSQSQYLYYGGFGSNSVFWGEPETNQLTNRVTFTGADFSNIGPDELFKLGTITYTNGSVYVDSIIFGATLTLAVNGSSVDPAVDRMGMITTINYGIDARADADVLTFEAFSHTFNVFEGQTAVADVFGKIIGDPILVITNFQLAPNQEGNGFIGQGVFLTPEPATLALLGLGLAGLGFSRRQQ